MGDGTEWKQRFGAKQAAPSQDDSVRPITHHASLITLSQDSARRQILQSQGLAKRFPKPENAFEALLAVQTQYPASVGPALAARSNGVTARWLERALTRQRTVFKGWNLRFTLHASLVEDHMLMQRAFEAHLTRGFAMWMGRHGVPAEDLSALHAQLMEALAEKPLGRKELHEAVPFYKGRFMVGWGLDAMGLAVEGKVVMSHQAAARTEFARMDVWSPLTRPSSLSPQGALQEVVRRYFRSYGPATYRDFLYWTGLGAAYAKPAFEAVLPELSEVEIEGTKGPHYLLGELRPAESLPVRLLPKFDPLIMGYRDKSLFLPEKVRDSVIRKAGQIEAVILADGQVRGTWRTVRKGAKLELRLEPFGVLRKSWLGGLQREAQRVALSLGFEQAILV